MYNIINISKAIAVSSFALGTILFMLQLYTNSVNLIGIGFVFVILSIIINPISVITLLLFLLRNSNNKSKILKAIGFVLLNIPITALYIYMLFFTRLNFINPDW